MKLWQARSMVEGAPMGNRNAAGAHSHVTGIVIGDTPRNHSVKAVTVLRTYRSGKVTATRRHPNKATLKRIGQAIGRQMKAGKARRVSGYNFGGRTMQTFAVNQ